MKPKYLQAETAGRDRWMISYMDLLTILLIFFVAVAAHAVQKPETPPPPPPKPVAVAPPPPAHTLLRDAERKLADQGLDLKMDERGLVISLSQSILFPSGTDQIGKDALPIVEQIAEVLHGIPNRVSLIGHTDSIPIHTRRFRNNWELSSARGLKLLELLSDRYGIPESRLSVASDGSFRPKDTNDTPDGRASNRRVEIVILDEPGA